MNGLKKLERDSERMRALLDLAKAVEWWITDTRSVAIRPMNQQRAAIEAANAKLEAAYEEVEKMK